MFCPAEYTIRALGFDPSENNPTGDESVIVGFDRRAAFKANLSWICDEAQGIGMLPGWWASSGATAEYTTAKALGLVIMELDDA